MNMSQRDPIERRAERLVRCYPKVWRARYGQEFVQLLVDEMTDAPRSMARVVDVVAHGLWARLAATGVVGSVVEREPRTRAMLGALAGVGVLFVLLAVGVWSQLTIGWQWSAPADPGTRTAMWLMSAALLGFACVLVLVIGLLGAVVVRRLAGGATAGVWRPVLVSLAAGVVLCLGCRHFGAHWPGTGGHSWPGRDFVPGWVARLGWAGTLWISAYWAHPDALRSFPIDEVAWMAISPFAWLTLLAAGIATVSRLQLTPRLHRWAVLIGGAVVGMMIVFLAGAGIWVFSSGPGPRNLFAVGTIDVAVVAVLAGGLIVATHLVRRVGGSISHVAS